METDKQDSVQSTTTPMGHLRGSHTLGKWSCNPPKGYPRFYSGKYRSRYVHRVIWEVTAGKPVPEGWHVHHQDFNKFNFEPSNFIAMPPCFNPAWALRCPITGAYLSTKEYEKRYGRPDEVPF